MTLKIADHIYETTSTAGAGAYNLLGAVAGFRSFSTLGDGAKVPYVVDDRDANGNLVNWETGIGTYSTGTNTLARTRISKSSNANAAVVWAAGTRNIRLGAIADATALRDENNNFVEGFNAIGGTGDALTMTPTTPPAAYSDGMEVDGFLTANNTGAATLAILPLAAKAIVDKGVALAANRLVNGYYFKAVYRALTDKFEIVFPINAAAFATAAQGAKADTSIQQGSAFSPPFLHIQDQRPSGTDGGTATSGAWATRTLNTEVFDNIGSTLSANTFTLPIGEYELDIKVPCTRCNGHQARLYDVTNNVVAVYGSSELVSSSAAVSSSSAISGRLTVTGATTTFRVESRVASTQATNGYGSGNGFGNIEIFTEVKIKKVG